MGNCSTNPELDLEDQIDFNSNTLNMKKRPKFTIKKKDDANSHLKKNAATVTSFISKTQYAIIQLNNSATFYEFDEVEFQSKHESK